MSVREHHPGPLLVVPRNQLLDILHPRLLDAEYDVDCVAQLRHDLGARLLSAILGRLLAYSLVRLVGEAAPLAALHLDSIVLDQVPNRVWCQGGAALPDTPRVLAPHSKGCESRQARREPSALVELDYS